MSLGEIFTLVVYGQLMLEEARLQELEADLIDQIFDVMVRDFSKFAVELYGKQSSTPKQMEYCLKMIKKSASGQAALRKHLDQSRSCAERRVRNERVGARHAVPPIATAPPYRGHVVT